MKALLMPLLLICMSITLSYSQKIPITNADELPDRNYQLPVKSAWEMVANPILYLQLANEVEKNLQEDLMKYDIQDRATLKHYHETLRVIATLKGEYDTALKHIHAARELSDKPAEKLMSGCHAMAFMMAAQETGIDEGLVFENELGKIFSSYLNTLPFRTVQEEIESNRGTMEILTDNLIDGQLKGLFQQMVDNAKGNVAEDLALSLLFTVEVKKTMLPYRDIFYRSYDSYYKANYQEVEKVDIWNARKVQLHSSDPLTPVQIGVWDTGVDMEVLPENNRWINPAEKLDGKDNDGNGFIDDMNGVAFDLDMNRSSGNLFPAKEENPDIDQLQKFSKGLQDLQAAIESEEASKLKKHIASLPQEEVTSFMEGLGLYGIYSHGTHVAGISAAGNPAAKIVVGRLSFDYHMLPPPPTMEYCERMGQSFLETVNYFKEHGVRVVNMSWGLSQSGLEQWLAINGVGETAEEREEMASRMFGVIRTNLYQAMVDAPEILFCYSAGNSNNDVDFAQVVPSSIDLPNTLTIGAVDIEGKKTSFTTEGKGVEVYANGYEVESFVPGGDRMKYSGTSMSSPNVANLAGKILALRPDLTIEQVRTVIIKGATPSEEDPSILLIHPKNSVKLAKGLPVNQ